ncbi:MAG: putative type secretion system protein [Planctomycetota bacterium]
MPEFAYIARNMRGERVSGTLSAGSEREAVSLLSGQSLFPVSVNAESKAAPLIRGRRVTGQLMATVFSQLAGLLRSGVPLLRSIGVLRDQTSHATLKKILSDVYEHVEQGETLAESMSRHQRVFSEISINMVRAGGEGGFLEDALERIAQFTEQQEDLKGRTVGALAYPGFLAVVGSSVVGGLIVFFVPKFGALFDNLRERGELPAATEWLLWLSETIRTYGLIVVVGVAIGFFAARTRLQSEWGRTLRDKLKLKVPVLGPIFQSLAVARFCRVLGTMLSNGVPILKSLDISRDATGNRVLSKAIAEASENISAGQSLASPLAASGYFPRVVVEMIAVAEESNSLDRVLVEIADGLEKRTFRRLDLAVRLIEPLMLLVMAVVVLLVVIALLMPVIKMSSTI